MKKIYCKDCGILLSIWAYRNKNKRCRSCAIKKIMKSAKHRERISKTLMGHKVSKKTRKKIRLIVTKAMSNPKVRNKISLNTKKALSGPEIKTKMRLAQKNRFKDPAEIKKSINAGKKRYKNNPNERKKISKFFKKLFSDITKTGRWQGGISFEPYGMEFNKKNKEKIRKRDGYKCKLCNKSQIKNNEKLSIHHIDYNKKNNDEKNHISLCRSCNSKVNVNKKYWTKYFQKIIKIIYQHERMLKNGRHYITINK